MTDFVTIAKDEFAFLRDDYDYESVAEEDGSNGGFVSFLNPGVGVGVKLQYEFASDFVFVFVYRLIDGQMRDNSLPITDDSEINCFDFNDYLAKDQKMRPAYEYGENSIYYDPQNGLLNFVKEFADRLRSHGDSILRGDLSTLPAMEKIIKKRAEDLRTT